MSNDLKLVATAREQLGKIHNRRLRSNGQTPAVMYGKVTETVDGADQSSVKSVAIALKTDQLHSVISSGEKFVNVEIDGKATKTILRDVQWDVFQQYIEHVDLLTVTDDQIVSIDVPITLRGTAPGVIAGGIMNQQYYHMPIQCAAKDIPVDISIRVSEMQAGATVHNRDVELPEGVTSLLPKDELLMQIVAPKRSAKKKSDEEEEEEK